MDNELEELEPTEIEEDNDSVLKSEVIPKLRKKVNIIDSDDSDDGTSEEKKSDNVDQTDIEEPLQSELLQESSKDNDEKETNVSVKSKRLAIIDSDSDGESENESVSIDPEKIDSENEKNTCTNVNIAKDIEIDPIYVTNKEGDLVPEDYLIGKTKQKLNNLCDSESSENDDQNMEVTRVARSRNKSKKLNKKVPKISNKKEKKMSAKEALKQRKEIFNESFKRLRNTDISIPYHKPKSRSLKDFLSKKPKISSTPLEVDKPASVAIKVTSQQLDTLTKKLEEREKIVEMFYKSESDSDCDEHGGNKNSLGSFSGDFDEKNNSENVSDTNDCNLIENDLNEEIPEKNDLRENNFEIGSEILDDNNKDNFNDCQEKNDENKLGEEKLNQIENNNCLENEKPHKINIISVISIPEKLVENSPTKNSTEEKENRENEKETENTKNNENMLNIDTIEYDFHLDEFEEEDNESETNLNKEMDSSETNKEDKILKNIINNFACVEEIPKENKTRDKLQLQLKDKINSFNPKLSGNPDEIIVFDDDTPTHDAITQLKGRFLNHLSLKKPKANTIHTEVVSFSGGKIHKEEIVLTLDVEEDERSGAVMETPGAKLKKLREKLENEIVQNKTGKWQMKSNKIIDNMNEDKKCSEKLEEDVIMDEDEENILTDAELTDEEEIEDDLCEKKMKKKSEFVDEEAEESDKEEDITDEEIENDVEEGDKQGEEDQQSEEDEDTNGEKMVKKHKRIIKGFLNDSSDEEEGFDNTKTEKNDLNKEKSDENENNKTPKKFNVEFDSTQSCDDDDDVLPAYQTRSEKTPVRQSEQTKDDFNFLTPVTFLTGLQSYSASKFQRKSPIESSSSFGNIQTADNDNDNETSPYESNKITSQIDGTQRKLVFDSTSSLNSQIFKENSSASQSDLESLAMLCSGTFSTQSQTENSENSSKLNENVPNNVSISPQTVPKTPVLLNKSSQRMIFEKVDTEVKNLANSEFDNVFISQLLDEEEMENFKKKFQSPIDGSNEHFNKSDSELEKRQQNSQEETDLKVKGGRLILDSDDEDQICEEGMKKWTKKKITFSDDDDNDDNNDVNENYSESEESQNNDDEEIDLHDDDGLENTQKSKQIHYNSEEDEVEYEQEYDDEENINFKPQEFFENEAELSEDEVQSEDELDNEELDRLEFEEGDKETFDEEDMRETIGKNYLRQVLDEDKRDVRILQEMLLEDGEMHGSGRQRQFRWKDLNLFNNDFPGKENEDGAENNQEEEEEDSEERSRKMSYYRELFLRQEKEKGLILEENESFSFSSDSQVIQSGLKVLERSQSQTNNILKNKVSVTTLKNISSYEQHLQLVNKRGSFLARNDKILARIAEMTKEPTNPLATGPVKSKNFLFHNVGAPENDKTSIKRKKGPQTPASIKKLKLSSMIQE